MTRGKISVDKDFLFKVLEEQKSLRLNVNEHRNELNLHQKLIDDIYLGRAGLQATLYDGTIIDLNNWPELDSLLKQRSIRKIEGSYETK